MAEAVVQSETYIVFTVAGTSYAVRSGDVQHMEMVEEVTRVPNAPPFVDGVVFSRGQVVPAVNLRARFGFERVPYDLRTRLLVVQTSGRSVGLVVDEARDFVHIAASAIEPLQDSTVGLSGQYVAGVATLGPRLVVVVDLPGLLEFNKPLVPA
jgi:purine-binding chemotaxis protein CheW